MITFAISSTCNVYQVRWWVRKMEHRFFFSNENIQHCTAAIEFIFLGSWPHFSDCLKLEWYTNEKSASASPYLIRYKCVLFSNFKDYHPSLSWARMSENSICSIGFAILLLLAGIVRLVAQFFSLVTGSS